MEIENALELKRLFKNKEKTRWEYEKFSLVGNAREKAIAKEEINNATNIESRKANMQGLGRFYHKENPPNVNIL